MSARFLEFVTHIFRNSAYQSLYRSIICHRGFELCKPEHQVSRGFCFSYYCIQQVVVAYGPDGPRESCIVESVGFV